METFDPKYGINVVVGNMSDSAVDINVKVPFCRLPSAVSTAAKLPFDGRKVPLRQSHVYYLIFHFSL